VKKRRKLIPPPRQREHVIDAVKMVTGHVLVKVRALQVDIILIVTMCRVFTSHFFLTWSAFTHQLCTLIHAILIVIFQVDVD